MTPQPQTWSRIYNLHSLKNAYLESGWVWGKKWPEGLELSAAGPALYIYFTRYEVKYVGRTDTLIRRTYQHLFRKEDNLRGRVDCANKNWWMVWMVFGTTPSQYQLLCEVERRVVWRLRPRWNLHLRPLGL